MFLTLKAMRFSSFCCESIYYFYSIYKFAVPSDPVQEPNVTCELNKISRTLSCSESSRFNVSYEWTGPGSAQQSGQELHISEEEKPDSVYTCTVKNEVSQKSSNFTLRDCDTGARHARDNNC